MYIPEFPYKNNQIILSSDRVMLHSKNDSIFLFGKKAVSLSSPETINLDASKKVLIDSPKIELGHKAEKEGEPVILGKKLNDQLYILTNALLTAAVLLKQVSTSNLGASMESIRDSADILYNAAQESKAYIDNRVTLSQNTFTR
jgi:hypothetical protein